MTSLTKSEKFIAGGIFCLILIMFGLIFVKVTNLQSQIDDTNSELLSQNEQLSQQLALLGNEIDEQKTILKPVIDVNEKTVVLLEPGIKLPYNDITKTLQYTYDTGEYGYLRVSSTLVSDERDESDKQLGCTELAIISFENGGNINPWTKVSGSVELADGRTMHIISPIAFESNEGSTMSCASDVWINVTPDQIADEFKKAQSI